MFRDNFEKFGNVRRGDRRTPARRADENLARVSGLFASRFCATRSGTTFESTSSRSRSSIREVFQRLRYVRQLGLAYLVYPGATHTRFEHALGTYHLSRRTLALLGEAEDLDIDQRDEQAIVRAAALLHDVGHYPFSHALEEIGALHHEDVARPLITDGQRRRDSASAAREGRAGESLRR